MGACVRAGLACANNHVVALRVFLQQLGNVFRLVLAVGGFLMVVFETAIAKMRVFRVPEFVGGALMLGLLGVLLLFVSRSF